MTRLSTLPSHREQAHHALVLLGVPAPARLVVDVHAALFDGDLSVPALAALLRDEQRSVPPGSGRGDDGGGEAASAGAPALGAGEGDDGGETAFSWRAPDVAPEGSATAGPAGAAGWRGGTARRPYLICPGLHVDLTAARGHLTLSTWPVANRICTPAVTRAEALAATVRIAEFVAMSPGRCATSLIRQLAESLPGGPEAVGPGAVADAARAALADPALAAAVAAEAPAREEAARRASRLNRRQRLFGVAGLPQQRDGA